jgi:hypothetical protein
MALKQGEVYKCPASGVSITARPLEIDLTALSAVQIYRIAWNKAHATCIAACSAGSSFCQTNLRFIRGTSLGLFAARE